MNKHRHITVVHVFLSAVDVSRKANLRARRSRVTLSLGVSCRVRGFQSAACSSNSWCWKTYTTTPEKETRREDTQVDWERLESRGEGGPYIRSLLTSLNKDGFCFI
jgi:hypothetical protein